MPKILRDNVVRLAHEGHEGVVKTKYRLRSKVWWSGMDKDVEKFVQGLPWLSSLLQVVTHLIRCLVFCLQVPLARLQCRFIRTLPTGESILVVFDYYSRFLEVAILKYTTSAKIIEAITPMFARFGVPFSLRTDNGPQFVSE